MNLGFIEQYKGLPTQIYILFFARTIAAMGAFVYPFLTLFLSSKLGYSELSISRYLLLVSIVYVPASLIGGKCGDIFPRKWVYIISMGSGYICFFISGFFAHEPLIVYLILLGYFFLNAGSPVIAAMMMDFTTEKNRQESFSLIYLGFNLGYAFGPLVAGFLFENYLPWIFWGNGILGVMAMTLIFFKIKVRKDGTLEGAIISTKPKREAMASSGEGEETRENAGPEADGQIASEVGPQTAREITSTLEPKTNLFRLLINDRILLVVALFATVYSFGYSQIGYILPLDMKDIFGIGMGSKYYGVVSSLNGIMVFAFTPLLVYLFKSKTPIFNIGIAGLLYGIGFGGYAFTHNILIMYLLVVIWSAGEVMSATNTGVFIANHAPEEYRARYQSIYEIIQGSGRTLGPLIMGYYLLGHTIGEGWQLVGVLCIVAAVFFIILSKTGKG